MGQRQSRVDPEARQSRAGEHEADGVGQPQAAGGDRHQDGEAEQAQRANEEFTPSRPV